MKDYINGFTLIELLIVVAIIGILATIALPNFLEAQTRAKVARVESEFRTISTALESYSLDYNCYFLDGDDFSVLNLDLWNQASQYARLTTPVAYLSSLLYDPFNTKKSNAQAMLLLFPGDPPYTYAYMTMGDYSTHQGNPKMYGIISIGPNGNFDSAANQGIRDTYDPTNGTVSRGDIIRYGPAKPF